MQLLLSLLQLLQSQILCQLFLVHLSVTRGEIQCDPRSYALNYYFYFFYYNFRGTNSVDNILRLPRGQSKDIVTLFSQQSSTYICFLTASSRRHTHLHRAVPELFIICKTRIMIAQKIVPQSRRFHVVKLFHVVISFLTK